MNLGQLIKAAEYAGNTVNAALEVLDEHPELKQVVDYIEGLTDEKPAALVELPATLESRLELDRAKARAARG